MSTQHVCRLELLALQKGLLFKKKESTTGAESWSGVAPKWHRTGLFADIERGKIGLGRSSGAEKRFHYRSLGHQIPCIERI